MPRILLILWLALFFSNSMAGGFRSIQIKFGMSCKNGTLLIGKDFRWDCKGKTDSTVVRVPEGKNLVFRYQDDQIVVPRWLVRHIDNIRLECLHLEESTSSLFMAVIHIQKGSIIKKMGEVPLVGFWLMTGIRDPYKTDSTKVYFEADDFEPGTRIRYREKTIDNRDWDFDPSTELCGVVKLGVGPNNRWLRVHFQKSQVKLRMPLFAGYVSTRVRAYMEGGNMAVYLHYTMDEPFFE